MDRRSILIIIIILVITIVFLYKPEVKDSYFCQVDSDCVPEQCCHPTSCMNIKFKPNCTDIPCTQVCQGPIDCGAGSCKCVSNRCQVIPQ